MRHRLRVAPGEGVRAPQIRRHDGEQGIERERALHGGDAIVGAAHGHQVEREPVVTDGGVGLERDGALKLPLGAAPVPFVKQADPAERRVRLGQRGVELERLERGGLAAGLRDGRRLAPVLIEPE